MENKHLADHSILLMSTERVKRSINRMAYQLAEDNRGASNVLIIGLKQRGFAVARLLADKLQDISSQKIRVVQLSDSSGQVNVFQKADSDAAQYNGNYTVIVDDVIFSGRTMLAAIELVMRDVDCKILRTAALVDRGHRTMPVEATFSGLELPTKLDEHVEVIMNEKKPDKVILTKAIT